LGGPQIKTFVLLSSAVAVLDSAQDMNFPGRDYTEEDWNTVRRLMPILHSSLFTLHSSLFTLHSSLFTLHSSLIK
jgi:hypothetical protein